MYNWEIVSREIYVGICPSGIKGKTVRKQFGATFEFVAKAKSLSLHLMKIQKVSYLR